MTYNDFKYRDFNWKFITDFSKEVKLTYNNVHHCIFDVISDTFYRENYHSDLLSYYFSLPYSKKQLISCINDKK